MTFAAEIRSVLDLPPDASADDVRREIRALRVVTEYSTDSHFDTVDLEGARVHADAVALLEARGIHEPSAEQIAAAYNLCGYEGRAA